MTEKERALMAIISAMRTLATTPRAVLGLSEGIHIESVMSFPSPHLQPGDIVISASTGIHEWTASIFLKYEDDALLVRELGGEKTCRLHNDWYSVLKGVRESTLYRDAFLTNEQLVFLEKVRKAFQRGGHYWHQFDHVEFPAPHFARIYTRVRWWASNASDEENIKHSKNGYRPFNFEMRYTAKTTIQAVLDALLTHGYGEEQVKQDVT